MKASASCSRRGFLAAVAALAACAEAPTAVDGAAPAASAPDAPLVPWRSVIGGFIGAPQGGMPARPTGMFVKLMRPGAVAIRHTDLLVADVATGRLWRADTIANTLVGIPGAPVSAQTAVVLGPDLSAWVLDPIDGVVLRFARDGRLLQTYRAGPAMPAPAALALADGGATLLLGDATAALWSEQRGPGGFSQQVLPAADGRRVSGVDAIAVAPGGEVFVLDRLAGAVHRVRRDGRVVATLGRGELQQPTALAIDRWERAWVVDANAERLLALSATAPTMRFGADALRVQRIGPIACDGDWLAVADPPGGQVSVLRLGAPR